jgi:hypothetical protein
MSKHTIYRVRVHFAAMPGQAGYGDLTKCSSCIRMCIESDTRPATTIYARLSNCPGRLVLSKLLTCY